MAQAQITIGKERKAPSALAVWIAEVRQAARQRRETRQILARMLEERESGRRTGARV